MPGNNLIMSVFKRSYQYRRQNPVGLDALNRFIHGIVFPYLKRMIREGLKIFDFDDLYGVVQLVLLFVTVFFWWGFSAELSFWRSLLIPE